MKPRIYTQAEVEQIFADAQAAAARLKQLDNWDAYVLGYVSASLGVELARYAELMRS